MSIFRSVLVSVLSSVTLFTAVTVAAPQAVAAPAAPSAADIGIGAYGAMFVDDARQQVFVGGASALAVYGFDGTRKATLPIAATAFALHAGILYVASGDTIRRVDPVTLREKSPLHTGFRDVGSIAWAGSRLWAYDTESDETGNVALYPLTAAGRLGAAVLTGQPSAAALVTAVAKPNVLWSWTARGCAGDRLVAGGGDSAVVKAFPDNGYDSCSGFAASPAGDKVAIGTDSADGVVELDGTTLRPDGVVRPAPPESINGRSLVSFGSVTSPLLVSWSATLVFPPPDSYFDVYPFSSTTKIRHLQRRYTKGVAGSGDGRLLFFAQGSGRDVQYTTFHVVALPAGS